MCFLAAFPCFFLYILFCQWWRREHLQVAAASSCLHRELHKLPASEHWGATRPAAEVAAADADTNSDAAAAAAAGYTRTSSWNDGPAAASAAELAKIQFLCFFLLPRGLLNCTVWTLFFLCKLFFLFVLASISLESSCCYYGCCCCWRVIAHFSSHVCQKRSAYIYSIYKL